MTIDNHTKNAWLSCSRRIYPSTTPILSHNQYSEDLERTNRSRCATFNQDSKFLHYVTDSSSLSILTCGDKVGILHQITIVKTHTKASISEFAEKDTYYQISDSRFCPGGLILNPGRYSHLRIQWQVNAPRRPNSRLTDEANVRLVVNRRKLLQKTKPTSFI